MLSVTDEAKAVEARAAAAGVPMTEVLAEAGVHRATWDRWKAGSHAPRLDKWRLVQRALERRECAAGQVPEPPAERAA